MLIPTNNANTADLVSRAIYKLTRPDDVAAVEDKTTHMLNYYVHPVSGNGLLDFPDELMVSVYPSILSTGMLDQVLSGFVADGVLSPVSKQAVLDAAEMHKGSSANVTQFIPAEFLAWSMTKSQALAAGYIIG